MSLTLYSFIIAGVLFLGMLLFLETGRCIGIRRLARDPEGARHGVGVVEGAVFGLLGLLLAFTFSGATRRIDARRQLIVEEATSIRTAWRHLDLLPPGDKSTLQELFRKYVNSRLETYQKLPDFTAAKAELARSIELQGEIWSNTVAACRERGTQPNQGLILPALDQMFDITTKRTEASKMHEPPVVFAVVGVVSLAASLLAGYGLAGGKWRSWAHTIGFATVFALTTYVILELEFPRFGLINLHDSDTVLIELRESMR